MQQLSQVDSTAPNDFNEGVVINIDKPLGWTSTDVVRKIRYLLAKCGYRKIKVGHAGTLDPLATGVLLVCVGRATKRVDELQSERKEYFAEIKFGSTTPSYDLEHEPDKEFPFEHITAEKIREALDSMRGEIMQVPPLYSAKKIDGQRAYDYAREGETVELKKVPVTVHEAELVDYQRQVAKVRICCSKGTYIRAIARDLGEMLSSGAHLISLRRTSSGGYNSGEGLSMDQIEEILHDVKQKRNLNV